MLNARAVEILFQQPDLLLWLLDESGLILQASHGHVRHFNLDPKRLAAQPAEEVVAADDHVVFQDARRRAHAGGSATVTVRLSLPAGEAIPVMLRLHKMAVEGVVQFLAVVHPHKAQDLDLFRILSDHVPSTVYLCRNDDTYSMLFLTEHVEELTGHPSSAYLDGTEDFVSKYHPDDMPEVDRQVAEALAAGRPFHLQYRLRHADGSYRYVDERGQGVWGDDGELALLAGSITDVTERVHAERKREALEQRLVQAQKLESLGMLAGGVAHDFNNLLVAIIGNIDLVREGLAPESEDRELLDQAVEASESAARLVRQMLTFAGRSPTETRSVDMRDLADSTCGIVSASQPRRVQIVRELGEVPRTVQGDVAQLQQVLMNLILNACEALGGRGGRVWVRLRRRDVATDDPVEVMLPAEGLDPAPYAVVEVEDEGRGIDTEMLGRIFDPFFTTKALGHGLGLASVVGTVRGHRGGIIVRSTPDRGTTFQILLPLVDAGEKVIRATTPVVLVVEDEPAVRRLAVTALRRSGYRVVEAENGRVGLAEFTKRTFDAILLDMNMPEIDGAEVLAVLAEKGVTVPVLITTGHAPTPPETGSYTGPTGFIAKPYRPGGLLEQMMALVPVG